jgi:RHS repeat-associated protein
VVSSAFLNVSKVNPYLYSGKEIDRMHGLNEYDFSARWQDPVVPGFTSHDPLAENTPWNSPYAYCGGDPVNRIDPTGMADLPTVECTALDLHKNGYIHNSDEALAYQYSQDHSNPNNGSPIFSEGTAISGLIIVGAPPEQSAESENKDKVLKENRLEKLPDAVGITADVMSTAGSAIRLATPALEEVAKRALTRPTTVVGAVIAGGVVAYDIYKNGFKTKDLVPLALAGGGVILEFLGVGEIADGVGLAVSVGSVAWDIYSLKNE